MNRFDRITALLIQLQTRRVVKAQDIAERFNISLRTVYRDIRTLEEAGVPLYGEAGVGYSLVEGYRLPPVMFTREEAIAFLTAEKLMEKFTDNVLQKNYTSAMYKIKAVLRGTEKDLVENLERNIVVKEQKRDKKPPENVLDILLKSIADKKAAQMVYKAFGNEDISERLVEPIGVFHEFEHWYTIAYCHLRQSYRQFRLDRILDLKLTTIAQQEHTSLKEYNDYRESSKKLCPVQKAVIRVDKEMVPYLEERRHYMGFVSEKIHKDYVDMTFLSPYEDGLARWFIMFCDKAEIIEPQSLKDTVDLLIEKMLKRSAGNNALRLI
jgi:predicted DNA-binding transcriptional regulator YafY